MEVHFQPGNQDVESVVEFGGAVIGSQSAGETAHPGKVARWQPVQAEPEQVVGLVGVDYQFLEFVEDVTVEEAEVGAIDAQGVGGCETDADEQLEEPLEGPKCSQGSHAQRSGQRSCDEQRHDAWVGQGQAAEVVRKPS